MPRVRATAARNAASTPGPRLRGRPSGWDLIWRNWRRRLLPALLACCGLGLALGALVTVRTLSAGDGLRERLGAVGGRLGLAVREVRFEGRQKTPEVLLNAALGVHKGDPILGFSVEAARTRIETIKWVQSAVVERQLPGTIVVRLTERRPYAVWQNDGKFVLIDRDGNVVTDSDVATFAGQLPLVVGAGAPTAAAALLDALADQPALAARVVAAVRVGERRWNLHLANGIDVLLPEAAEARALARLADLQTNIALLDRPLAVVDLRLPDRLVVRPQPEKAAPAAKADPAHAASQPAKKT